jgi:hypothetical protein
LKDIMSQAKMSLVWGSVTFDIPCGIYCMHSIDIMYNMCTAWYSYSLVLTLQHIVQFEPPKRTFNSVFVTEKYF